MPAIVTDRFKKELLLRLEADIADSANNYYVGIGRTYVWDSSDEAPTPTNSVRQVRNAQLDLISVKNVEAYSFVIPRYTWTLGALYTGYNDNTTGHPLNSYYVITDENQVYICLRQAKNSSGQGQVSTIKPTGTLTTPFATADGYVWKFLYSIGALKASQFLASNFMPVTKYAGFDSDDTADQVEQVGIQNAAIAGQVVGYTVVGGGSGYTTAPTVVVHGDGSGAKASATVSGGAVTKVDFYDSNGSYTLGSGYSYASVSVIGVGTGANIRPIIGPKAGFGADPRDDLKATAMMFTAKPDGAEGGNWVVGNDFREVVLIKNPLKGNQVADSDFTATTGSALNKLAFSAITSNFTADKTIIGGTSQTTAYVAKTDSDEVWYIQNETTGFKQFLPGESITETDGSGSGTLQADSATALFEGDVERLSGEVVYIDNRAAVSRSADQSEDIKIIIQL